MYNVLYAAGIRLVTSWPKPASRVYIILTGVREGRPYQIRFEILVMYGDDILSSPDVDRV